MKFYVEPRPAGYAQPVIYETDEIALQVGELSPEKGGWVFHHHPTSNTLKPGAHAELIAWTKDAAALMNLTQRMLK